MALPKLRVTEYERRVIGHGLCGFAAKDDYAGRALFHRGFIPSVIIACDAIVSLSAINFVHLSGHAERFLHSVVLQRTEWVRTHRGNE